MADREPWIASLRESVEACERQGYLQPWFAAKVVGLIAVAEAAETFRCLDHDEGVAASIGELDDALAMRVYRSKQALFDALSRAANSHAESDG